MYNMNTFKVVKVIGFIEKGKKPILGEIFKPSEYKLKPFLIKSLWVGGYIVPVVR